MHQTTKYALNLIDPADEFSPDPLNENANKIDAELACRPRYHLFQYTGDKQLTRTHTFPFEPQMVLIWGIGNTPGPLLVFQGQEKGIMAGSTTSSNQFDIFWNEKTVTFTAKTTAGTICNGDLLYRGIVFG